MHIEDAHYLHPQKRNHSMAKSGISNLTLKFAKVFGKKSQAVFKTSATPNEIVDLLRLQWSMHQIEEIPPSMYLAENEFSKRENHHQTLYWKYALNYCGLFVDKGRPKSKYVRADTYWHADRQMTNEDSILRYPQLFALAKAVLNLSHGSVVPERGFSINKCLLWVHGYSTSTKEDTVMALRLVKDELCSVGGLSNFKITKSLLQSVKHILVTKRTWKLKEKSRLIKNEERRRKDRRNKEKKRELRRRKQNLNWINTSHLWGIVSSNWKVPCLGLTKISRMHWKPLFLWKNEFSMPMP